MVKATLCEKSSLGSYGIFGQGHQSLLPQAFEWDAYKVASRQFKVVFVRKGNSYPEHFIFNRTKGQLSITTFAWRNVIISRLKSEPMFTLSYKKSTLKNFSEVDNKGQRWFNYNLLMDISWSKDESPDWFFLFVCIFTKTGQSLFR